VSTSVISSRSHYIYWAWNAYWLWTKSGSLIAASPDLGKLIALRDQRENGAK
jgi:hypothetical protein